VSERIAVDGEYASIEEMEAAAERIVPLRDEIPYSYFEALTAIAFLIFAARGVEVAVLEVGLGGRFDATNVVEPAVSVITSISLDHRRILGDTEEEILREKLGVARPNVPLLVGPLSAALAAIAAERGEQNGFPVLPPEGIGSARVVGESLDALEVELRTPRAAYGRVRVPFGGRHQAFNALLAVGAAEQLLPRLERLTAGIQEAFIPGRFQCVERGERTFVIDVAHNEAALRATADHLSAFVAREDCAVVFGMLRRKELFEAPAHLLRAAGTICLVEPHAEPGSTDTAFAPHEMLARFFAPLLPNAAANVMLWNRAGERDDPLARLVRWFDGDGRRCRVVLATGSHRVVEDFGRHLFPVEATERA
jgi:folylpolyglutamate synthase/dihydrofolate synthase